jgi:ribosomal small subunit protein bTHX
MGKGDVRGRRGKIFNGSYGKKRLHKKRKKAKPAGTPAAKVAA